MSTLDVNNKQLNVIDDNAFTKSFRRMYRTFKPALPLGLLSAIISLTLLVFYFIFRARDCAPYILSLVILFGIIAIGFIVLRVLFGLLLKKPRL